MTSFRDFGFAEPILAALDAAGYETPTPIQTQAIPHAVAGRDLLGIAQTGTGKTAAFALPIIQRLIDHPNRPAPHSARSLVLAPTRELAAQIAESFRTYAHNLRLSVEVVFGGVSIGRQERALMRGVDVLVATPGRLLDLVDRGSCRLDRVEALVLDEADQMLDLGFIHALRRIAKLVPKARQTLFFSATMPTQIASLADGYLAQPVKVAVTPVATTAERVEQSVYFCDTRLKQALLEHLLVRPDFDRVIVFTRTKHGADRVVKHLSRAGIEAAAIHGNKSQGQRERALAAFRDGEIGTLVATDIAARGIDIDGISHVVNFELPNVPESYVHRIGRTARAGADGSAVSFCNGEERAYLKSIERLIRRNVQQMPVPKSIEARAAEIARAARTEIDEDRVDFGGSRSEGHRHAGRPQGGHRNDTRPQGGHRTDTRPQGGPRNEARPQDGEWTDSRSQGGRGRNDARRDGPRNDARPQDGERGESRSAARNDGRPQGGRRGDARTGNGPRVDRPQGGRDEYRGEAGRNDGRRDGGSRGERSMRDGAATPSTAFRDTRHGESVGGRGTRPHDGHRMDPGRDERRFDAPRGERPRSERPQGDAQRRGGQDGARAEMGRRRPNGRGPRADA